MVLGLILGYLYAELLKKDYYKSSMVLSCDYLNTEILKNTIAKFNLLAAEKGGAGLRDELKVDSTTATNVQKFEFKSFVSEDDIVEMEVLREQLNNVTGEKRELVEKVIDRLEIENKNAYEISVFVYDPGAVKPLEKALVEYFMNNEYIRLRMESRNKNLQARKAKLQKDLRKLDSLKNAIYANYQALAEKGRGSNNVLVGDEGITNPIEVYRTDLTIHEELQEVEEELYLSPDFEVVEGFTSFRQPENASLFNVMAVSLLLSLLVGYLILGVYSFDRMLAEYPSKHP
jgi:hypothetical protein